jgi:hypothetical protein
MLRLIGKLYIVFIIFIYGVLSVLLLKPSKAQTSTTHDLTGFLSSLSHCPKLSVLIGDRLAQSKIVRIQARLIEESSKNWHLIKPRNDLRVQEAKELTFLLMARFLSRSEDIKPKINQLKLIQSNTNTNSSNTNSSNTNSSNTNSSNTNSLSDWYHLGIHTSDTEGWINLNLMQKISSPVILSQISSVQDQPKLKVQIRHSLKVQSKQSSKSIILWQPGLWELSWFALHASHAIQQRNTDKTLTIDQLAKIKPHIRCRMLKQKIRVLTPPSALSKFTNSLSDTMNYDPIVIRSDLDMTYLYTQFHRTRDLFHLLNSNALQRTHIKGMPEIYRRLRQSQTQATGFRPRPITFLSGSPFFFFRSLISRIRLDQLPIYDLRLKPFKSIIKNQFMQLSPHKIKKQLKDQVSYKLLMLLRMRLDLPVQWKEVLIGDDQESDLMIYQIYHAITAQRLTLNELFKVLDQQQGNYPVRTWYAQVKDTVQQVWAQRSAQKWGNAVHSIFIHQSKSKTCKKWNKAHAHQQSQKILAHSMIAQRITHQNFPFFYFYCNATQLALSLNYANLLDEKDIRALKKLKIIQSKKH